MKSFNKILLTLLISIFLLPVSLYAFDFGLITNLNVKYGNPGADENKFDFAADFWPRFYGLIGKDGEFIVTGGITLGVNDDFYYVPELLHTELTLHFGGSGLRIGRFNYSDPLALAASGLFDGVQYYHNSGIGVFRAGAWYTGFLYKKNANITMTEAENAAYGVTIDYNDFVNTYFAPSRAFVSAEWEHPSLGEFMHLNAAVIAQFDLTDADSKYHNQYVILKAGIPAGNFLIELGGILELAESNTALAGEFGLSYLFSSEFNSRLSFKGTIASGKVEDTLNAFVPITTRYYGYILEEKMSALSVFSLNYSTRLHQTFGASANASYFVRSDLGTFRGYPAAESSEGFFLGPEFSASLIWSPFSDLQLNLGGGIFAPALGDAGPDENLKWRVSLGAILSLI